MSPVDVPVFPPVYPTILPSPTLTYPSLPLSVDPVVCPPGLTPEPPLPSVTDIEPGLFNCDHCIDPPH